MKKFFQTFFYWIIGFVFIAIIIDVSQNIDKLIESKATFPEILFQYYFPFSIFFGNLLSPFLVFISVIWVASNMAQKSELIAVLSGGVSFNRMIQPFMVSALIVTVLSLLGSNFIVPKTNKIKYDFESEYTRGMLQYGTNIHRELQTDTLYNFSALNEKDSLGYNFERQIWKDGRLVEKLRTDRAEWVTGAPVYTTGWTTWKLKNAMIRNFEYYGSENYTFTKDTVLEFNMRLSDFGTPDEILHNMNIAELNEYLEQERKTGSEKITLIEVEKNSRPANALSILILTFIAVSIASRKTRGGMGIHLLLAVVIGAAFVFSARLSAVSALNVGFPASIAVWIPNILFLLLGLWIYKKAPK